MDFYRILWISIEFYGFLWVIKVVEIFLGKLRKCLEKCSNTPWHSIEFYGKNVHRILWIFYGFL